MIEIILFEMDTFGQYQLKLFYRALKFYDFESSQKGHNKITCWPHMIHKLFDVHPWIDESIQDIFVLWIFSG